MARLVAIRGPTQGKAYTLKDECSLGRGLSSDIYIGDLNVSRRHAVLHALENGEFEIEDLGSGNGTFVNEVQVGRQQLKEDDLVRIGGTSFRYEPSHQQRWSEEVLTVIADLSQEPQRALQPYQTSPGTGLLSTTGISDGRALKMLESMCAVADVIASELELPKLFDAILNYLFDLFPQSERGFVFLINETTGQLVPEAVRQRSGELADGLQFSQTMINQVLEKGEGVIRGQTASGGSKGAGHLSAVSSISDGDSFQLDGGDDGPALEAAPQMGTPLIYRGVSLGVIHLESQPGSRSFSRRDLDLLSAIGRQAAVAIASARAAQALVMQRRLEEDLRLARQIQRGFLPHKLMQVPGLVFETLYLPALQVGGDFYDIIALSPSRVGILIGDISGKGVSAALLMAQVATDIRLLARLQQSPAEILTEANRTFTESEQEGMFSTVLYLEVDLAAQTLTVANAGHQPPLVISPRFEGVAELDDATSLALGVLPETSYPQAEYSLLPGDVILLYTDGINEAKNRADQEFGVERLRTAIMQPALDPARLVRRLMTDVRRFVGGAPQSDDQTVVAFALAPAELSPP